MTADGTPENPIGTSTGPSSSRPAAASDPSQLSVNALSRPLVARLMDDRVRLRIKSSTTPEGTCIVDAGIGVPGSTEAGLAVATICTAGLATFRLRADSSVSGWPTWIDVQSSQPVLACLGSQYAGWSLSASKEETGARKFFALGSGPARALYAREEIFKEIGYSDVSDTGCLVMEVDRPPPPSCCRKCCANVAFSPPA
jgi:methenyltetrahydromethanopterin cyclohydrolase